MRVKIRGAKGTKEVVEADIRHGKKGRTRRSKKALKKKEVECIRCRQFIPGLFRECEQECSGGGRRRATAESKD